MTISRITLIRESTVVEKTTVDVTGPDDANLRRTALARSKDLDLLWEKVETKKVGKAAVDDIETLAEDDEDL